MLQCIANLCAPKPTTRPRPTNTPAQTHRSSRVAALDHLEAMGHSTRTLNASSSHPKREPELSPSSELRGIIVSGAYSATATANGMGTNSKSEVPRRSSLGVKADVTSTESDGDTSSVIDTGSSARLNNKTSIQSIHPLLALQLAGGELKTVRGPLPEKYHPAHDEVSSEYENSNTPAAEGSSPRPIKSFIDFFKPLAPVVDTIKNVNVRRHIRSDIRSLYYVHGDTEKLFIAIREMLQKYPPAVFENTSDTTGGAASAASAASSPSARGAFFQSLGDQLGIYDVAFPDAGTETIQYEINGNGELSLIDTREFNPEGDLPPFEVYLNHIKSVLVFTNPEVEPHFSKELQSTYDSQTDYCNFLRNLANKLLVYACHCFPDDNRIAFLEGLVLKTSLLPMTAARLDNIKKIRVDNKNMMAFWGIVGSEVATISDATQISGVTQDFLSEHEGSSIANPASVANGTSGAATSVIEEELA